MELVYLWVEKYKNIQKQGFNFSPRFKFEYDGENLTIKENKEYVSIFPENINITAIVGENGSGKSSVLELLIKIANKHDSLDTKCFFIYKKLEQWYVVGNIILICNSSLKNSFFNDESINWINYLYSRNDNELKRYVERQSTFNKYGGNKIWKHTQVYNKFSNILSSLEKKYKFNTFLLKIKPMTKNILEEKDTLLDDKTILLCKEVISSFYSKKQFSIENITMESLLAHNTFLLFVTFYIMNKALTKESFIDIIEDIKSDNNIDFIFEKLENFNKTLGTNNDFEMYFQQLKFLKKNIDKFLFDGKEFYIWNVELSDMDNIIDNTKVISGIEDPETYFYLMESVYYDFSNNQTNIFYNDLSNGEKEILNISIDFLHHLDFPSNDSIFIFDEIDNSLHPIWKKEILKILINIFKEFKKIGNKNRIHLIFTTHSPFLLSDIPKQNIIFLDKDEKGNCKVVDGLKEKKQTFGANIHTLLSDSFFMEDGLMGEFAKSKIDKVINLLNQYKLSEEDLKYCEQIISIIGEPIVKNQLQRMLDSKRLKKVDEIDAIKKSMEAMQKRLDELEK